VRHRQEEVLAPEGSEHFLVVVVEKAMNMSIRLFLFSCLLAAPLYAQTDSLEARLAQVSGREKVEVLVALVEAHRSNDPEQAIAYGREALALLQSYPDAGLEGNVWFHKGSAHYVVSQDDRRHRPRNQKSVQLRQQLRPAFGRPRR